MNEDELSHAMRGTVAAGSPPLALDAAGMLARAKRGRVRRRAGLAVATSAVAVCALAGATALSGNLAFGGNHGGAIAAGGGGAAPCPSPSSGELQATKLHDSVHPHPTGSPTGTPTATPTATPTGTPTATPTNCGPSGSPHTETPWPSGQTDRTAHNGPHTELAQMLQSTMLSGLPAGARAVEPHNQAQYEKSVGQTEIWEYLSLTGVQRRGSNGVASLIVRVESATPGDHTDLCTLARYFQDRPGPHCTIRSTAGTKVAVATRTPGNSAVGYSPEPQTWIVFRAANGNVLYLAEGNKYKDHPAATTPVYTTDQLIALAVSGRFTG
jgi:hypothetical protein